MLKQALTFIFIGLATTLFAQTAFEGTVVMETTTAKTDEEATVTLFIKNMNTRMDYVSKTSDYNSEYSIFVDEKGTDMVSQGEITKIDLKTAVPTKGTMTPIVKEGNVSKDGFNCTHYQFFDGKLTTEYWISDAFNLTMDQLPFIFQQGMPKPEGGIRGVPVAILVTDANGNVVSTQKLISVSAGKIAEEVFERR